MSLAKARKLCPSAVILKGDQNIYRCFAERIWRICGRYTVGLETFLDEAYGDATGIDSVYGGPLALARRLQQDVLDEVGLPVSIGLASNRMVAGIASHLAKPHGVSYVPPGTEERFIGPLPIEELTGVGRKTAGQLHDMNIRTIEQLRLLPLATMSAMLHRRGEILYERCRGRDVAPPIQPSAPEDDDLPGYGSGLRRDELDIADCGLRIADSSRRRPWQRQSAIRIPQSAIPKSISRETTFHQRQCDQDHIRGMLFYLLERAMRTARQAHLAAQCVEVRIRYDDFKSDARHGGACRSRAASKSLPEPTDADDLMFQAVLELLARLHRRRVALRHVGVTLSRLTPRSGLRTLLGFADDDRRHKLYQAIDGIRDRFGHAAMVTGKSIELLGRLEQNDYGFVLRTPSLTK
jgi:DNA polymerase-4